LVQNQESIARIDIGPAEATRGKQRAFSFAPARQNLSPTSQAIKVNHKRKVGFVISSKKAAGCTINYFTAGCKIAKSNKI
jgi:hypothetical protein